MANFHQDTLMRDDRVDDKAVKKMKLIRTDRESFDAFGD